jgi:8-oxo-dGTP pyrophosphatase MutT (NUDIX family)
VAQVYLAVLAPASEPWTHALLAKKRVTNSYWRGALQNYTDPVNQAGQWALPGGKKEGSESVHEAARREFTEETGYDIRTQYPQHPIQGVLGEYPFSKTGALIEGPDLLILGIVPPAFWLAVLRVSLEQQRTILTQVNQNIAPKMRKETKTAYVSMTTPTNAGISKPATTRAKMPIPQSVIARQMREGTYKPPTQTKPPEQHTYTVEVETGRPSNQLIQDWELGSLEVVARADVSNRLGVYCQLVGVSDRDKLIVQSADYDSQDISWYKALATFLTKSVA